MRATAKARRSSAGCSRTKATALAPESDAIDAFCDRLWLQDGLAPASLAAYRRDLSAWSSWLHDRGSSLNAAARSDIEAWLADQFAAKARTTSIGRRLSALRRYYRL